VWENRGNTRTDRVSANQSEMPDADSQNVRDRVK
jgi:hypothetical protein